MIRARIVARMLNGIYGIFGIAPQDDATEVEWPTHIPQCNLFDHTGACDLVSVSPRMILYAEVPAHVPDVPVQRPAPRPDAHLGAIESHEYDPGWVVGDAAV